MSENAPPLEFPSFGERHRFPPTSRPSFAEHWQFKCDLRQQFNAAWGRAYFAVAAGEPRKLPEEIRQEWESRWALSVFTQPVSVWDGMSPPDIASAVTDLGAVVEALECTRSNHSVWSRAKRVTIREYPDPHRPGRFGFPTVQEAEEDRRDRYLRGTCTFEPYSCDRCRRYDVLDFLEHAAFLLSPDVPNESRDWLTRLAVETDTEQPIWSDPPEFQDWSRTLFERTLPALSRQLRLLCPPQVLDRSEPFQRLVVAVQNWCVEASREGTPRLPGNTASGKRSGTTRAKRRRGHPGIDAATKARMVELYAKWKEAKESHGTTIREFVAEHTAFQGMTEDAAMAYMGTCAPHWRAAQKIREGNRGQK